jgi:hypothetical protein
LGRHIWFAEFQRIKCGRVSVQQKRWIERLGKAGFSVYVIDNEDDFEAALKKEKENEKEK